LATLVEGADCVDAWRTATALLLERGPLESLIVTILDPAHFDPREYRRWTPSQITPGILNQSDVANTIFPQRLYNRFKRTGLYRRYREIQERARRMRRHPGSWGTYFSRAIDFGASHINQLELVIQKLTTWDRQPRAALVIHLSSAETDGPRTRGGPCLQMLEIVQPSAGVLDLVAIYRSQDYCNRALGNFIGLGRLLSFLCAEAERTPGQLVIHAIHAYYGGPIRKTRSFLAGT
jgi:hypothetical protein